MIARTTHVPKLVVLLALVVVGLFMLLSRPAAQTNGGIPVDVLLRDAKVIADSLGNLSFAVDGEAVDGDVLIRFYNLRHSRLAWSGTPRALASAAIAMRALSKANEHGLDATQFHLKKLADSSAAFGVEEVATYDILLTDAILKYARQLRNGRPGGADDNVDLPSEGFDAISAINSALDGGTLAEFLADLPPGHAEYKRLTGALARYRKLADDGGWPAISPDANSDLLRKRLAYEDDAVIAASDVTEALRRYQRRNGMDPDGNLGPQTLAALNTPAAERVEQIEANMERWRWLPRQLEPRRVMVDAADATLTVVDNDQILLRSNVIVGAPGHPTPIIRAMATGVTVNPPWNVPASIARNEFLPRLRKDPNFLRSQNIVILNGPADDPHGTRIDWARLSPDNFPYRLQQRPGTGNALGQIKLEMPNAFSVYLHDTPGKREFLKPQRTLSHGCVRVEEILPLASLALGGDTRDVAEKLSGAAITGETRFIALDHPLPIYVLYWTTIGNVDGTVQFRRDVYSRDRRLVHALRSGLLARDFFTGVCGREAG